MHTLTLLFFFFVNLFIERGLGSVWDSATAYYCIVQHFFFKLNRVFLKIRRKQIQLFSELKGEDLLAIVSRSLLTTSVLLVPLDMDALLPNTKKTNRSRKGDCTVLSCTGNTGL